MSESQLKKTPIDQSTQNLLSADVTEGITPTSAEVSSETSEALGPILSRYFGINSRALARSKTWSSWSPDPLILVGSTTRENLSKIEDIRLTLTESSRSPSLRLWAYLEFKRSSLGWRSHIPGGNFSYLTLLLKNSTGGVVFDVDVPRECRITCGMNQVRASYTFDIDVDIYEIVTGASLVTSSQTYYRC